MYVLDQIYSATSSHILGQDLRVMEHEIKAAAAVSGADIDHTVIILPTEEEEAKFTMSASETSHHHTWRSFLSKNDCNIDSLPKNNVGNHMLSGTFRSLLVSIV